MSNNQQGNQNNNQPNNQQENQNGGQLAFNTNTTVLNTTGTQAETGRSMGTKMDVQTIAIIGGVGILVIVIIIAQTIALCYFKRKAKPRRRMDTLTSRTRFDRGDTARYSAPPSRKGNARAQADTDSHIYEMVGVNALYKESKELNQEGKTDANGRNIKNRPPLPLPDEVPDVPLHTLPRPKPSPLKSAVSTSSLISKSSTLTKKGKDQPPSGQPRKPPVRPPKQTEEDMPGSLKRPPKALPTSVAPKTGSIPKMPATDPAMLELKNMFKNRNIGNDSPAPSPTTTLEKPKIQAKPFQKPKPEEPKPIPKPIGINPLVQGPSQIRLILPKIEATLKAPKTAPNLKPVTLKKPMTSQQTSHPSTVSQLTSTSHPTPIASRPTPPIPNLTRPSTSHVPPLQSRPLPPIRASRPLQKPNEASTRRLPPDPTPDPIYQMAEEDESPQTDDDEEWTYEQLGQYNLYNI